MRGASSTTARSSAVWRPGPAADCAPGCSGGLGQLATPRVQVRPDRIGVAGAVAVVAQGVDQQLDLAQTQCLEETGRERDDLDVQVGVIDAEHLDSDLVEHPVAALLGTFMAEVGAGVPDLPGQGRAVLHERADDPAVISGRSAIRDPSLSTKSYISLVTTSVVSPTRRNTPRSSTSGGTTSP